MKALLGSDSGASLFNQRRQLYLARGHLAPDADFVYKEWQYATYYFVNVAPQWQSFNNGNWKAVEVAVRAYAARAARDITVFTGTLGQLALPDDSGRKRPVFLEKTGRQFIPVPEFYWKAVYDPSTDEAIVFVGLNNPHFSDGDPAVHASICPDRCVEARWFFGHQKKVEKGFLYCCSFQDFKGGVPWAPDIGSGDPGLLKNFLGK